jgi:hypothetical protein
MSEPAEDMIVHNLIEALEHLREDLNRVELWAAALGQFQTAVPEYAPGNQYLLPKAQDRKRTHRKPGRASLIDQV